MTQLIRGPPSNWSYEQLSPDQGSSDRVGRRVTGARGCGRSMGRPGSGLPHRANSRRAVTPAAAQRQPRIAGGGAPCTSPCPTAMCEVGKPTSCARCPLGPAAAEDNTKGERAAGGARDTRTDAARRPLPPVFSRSRSHLAEMGHHVSSRHEAVTGPALSGDHFMRACGPGGGAPRGLAHPKQD